jgi:hypothetical protein
MNTFKYYKGRSPPGIPPDEVETEVETDDVEVEVETCLTWAVWASWKCSSDSHIGILRGSEHHIGRERERVDNKIAQEAGTNMEIAQAKLPGLLVVVDPGGVQNSMIL